MVRLILLFLLASLTALAIQTSVPLWFPSHSLIPNLIVILAVDLGLRHHGVVPALIAFGMGYATDAFSGTHIGLNAFLITLVFLVTYEVASRLMVTNVLVGTLLVFVGVMLAGLGGTAIASGGAAWASMAAALPGVLLQALVSTAVAPIMFAILSGAKRAIGLRVKAERE